MFKANISARGSMNNVGMQFVQQQRETERSPRVAGGVVQEAWLGERVRRVSSSTEKALGVRHNAS